RLVSDWSSDVCSSDLVWQVSRARVPAFDLPDGLRAGCCVRTTEGHLAQARLVQRREVAAPDVEVNQMQPCLARGNGDGAREVPQIGRAACRGRGVSTG